MADPSARSGAPRKRSGAATDDARALNDEQSRRRAGTDGAPPSAPSPAQPDQLRDGTDAPSDGDHLVQVRRRRGST